MMLTQKSTETFAVRAGDPNSAMATCTWDKVYARDTGWRVALSVKATVRALREVWRMETEFLALDGDEVVKQETRTHDFPRDLN